MRIGKPEKIHIRYRRRIRSYVRRLSKSGVPLPENDRDAGNPMAALDLVMAPALNLFVLWVLQEAERMGIRRLYFLARDGFCMRTLAEMYCEKLGIGIQCRYLYCSRYSLRLPVYHRDPEEALAYICGGGLGFSMERILIRSGFTRQDAEEIFPLLGYSGRLEDVISDDRLPEIRELLASCPAYMERLRQRSREAEGPLRRYLEQEGLLEDCSMALVDSGWTGTTQKSLNDMLRWMGKQNGVGGFYFGLYTYPKSEHPYRGFWFSPEKSPDRGLLFNGGVFEALLAAPHGTTVGYRERDGRMEPVLGAVQEQSARFFEVARMRYVSYAGRLLESLDPGALRTLETEKKMNSLSGSMMELMWNPTRQEAETFGALPFSDDLKDKHLQPLAAPLTGAELNRNHVLYRLIRKIKKEKTAVSDTAWYEGSAVLSGRGSAWHRINFLAVRAIRALREKRKNMKEFCV